MLIYWNDFSGPPVIDAGWEITICTRAVTCDYRGTIAGLSNSIADFGGSRKSPQSSLCALYSEGAGFSKILRHSEYSDMHRDT